MSNDVVISKELCDHFVYLLESLDGLLLSRQDASKALRAAPETVSLEGVDRWSEGASDFGLYRSFDGEWVRFSDLRRLVGPVQSSAVDLKDTQQNLSMAMDFLREEYSEDDRLVELSKRLEEICIDLSNLRRLVIAKEEGQ